MAAATSASAAGAGDIVLHARRAAVVKGAWSAVSDPTAAGGVRLANPDAGIAKVSTASASPASYFELTFTAEAGRAYHLWIRSKARDNSWTNDSVYVQFSGSRTSSGGRRLSHRHHVGGRCTASKKTRAWASAAGAGRTTGMVRTCWAPRSISTGRSQTIRVQAREDGISIDQIVLSPVSTPPRRRAPARTTRRF